MSPIVFASSRISVNAFDQLLTGSYDNLALSLETHQTLFFIEATVSRVE